MWLRPALFFASLSTALLGQGVVPPFQIGQVNPLPGFSGAWAPMGGVLHVHLTHLPSDPPSVFYCAVTVRLLWAPYDSDLLCGSYDVLTDTFTPNNEAAALNTTGREIGMTVHHSGLLAVFDRVNGWAWLASRPAIGQPWQVVGQIGQVYGQSVYNPALADYQGQLYLLYSIEWTPALIPRSIVMQRIDPTTAQVSGPPIEIVRAAGIYSVAHSPIPVTDPTGELIGVSHYDRDGWVTESDHYMSLDLDPSTPSVLMNDATTWTGPGGFVGGRFFDCDSFPSPHIFAIDTFWFTGGRAPVGGTMHVRMFSPPTSGPQVYLSLFAVGSAFLPAGLPIPGVPGLVGINAAGGWTSPLFVHNNANGEAQASFVIPNSPGLSGARLCAQSATLEAGIGAVRLGNTAMLIVD